METGMREPEGFSRVAMLGASQLALTCDDDFRLEATCHEAAGTPRAIIVLASAFGVGRRYYARFGEFLAAQGVACLSFDYRGVGDSAPGPGQESLIDFERWGRLDIDAAIRGAAMLYPGTPIFLIGHSCGAQLFGLAPACEQLAGAVMVAGSLPHTSRYPRPDRYMLALLWRVLIPLLTRGAPEKLVSMPGLYGALAPKRAFAQWGRWCRSKQYLFDPKFGLDTTRYASFARPILALAISDDEAAPVEALGPLLERFPAASIERRMVDALQLGFGTIGHMGFFRTKLRDAAWFPLLSWILRTRDEIAAA